MAGEINTRAWRALRDQVVDEEPVCRLQFPEICTYVSTTADHIEPRSARPDLAMVRANLRGACEPCNSARNNTPDAALNLGGAEAPAALGIFD